MFFSGAPERYCWVCVDVVVVFGVVVVIVVMVVVANVAVVALIVVTDHILLSCGQKCSSGAPTAWCLVCVVLGWGNGGVVGFAKSFSCWGWGCVALLLGVWKLENFLQFSQIGTNTNLNNPMAIMNVFNHHYCDLSISYGQQKRLKLFYFSYLNVD